MRWLTRAVCSQLIPDTCSSVIMLPTQISGSSYIACNAPTTLLVSTGISAASSNCDSSIAPGFSASSSSSTELQLTAPTKSPTDRTAAPRLNTCKRVMFVCPFMNGFAPLLEVEVERQTQLTLHWNCAVVGRVEVRGAREVHL